MSKSDLFQLLGIFGLKNSAAKIYKNENAIELMSRMLDKVPEKDKMFAFQEIQDTEPIKQVLAKHIKGIKTYYTHHNMSRPYKVEIFPGADYEVVISYLSSDGFYKPLLDLEIVHTVFVGAYVSTKYEQASEPGNSILIQEPLDVSKGTMGCFYVGHKVYLFEPDSPIEEYYSPIGNSDVPYPYAITKNRIYLMLEDSYKFNGKHYEKYVCFNKNDPVYLEYLDTNGNEDGIVPYLYYWDMCPRTSKDMNNSDKNFKKHFMEFKVKLYEPKNI